MLYNEVKCVGNGDSFCFVGKPLLAKQIYIKTRNRMIFYEMKYVTIKNIFLDNWKAILPKETQEIKCEKRDIEF